MGLDTKYRPKNFKDVIGQDVAVTILSSSIALNKLSSSYLFSGPSGVGKTTIARIFAKAVMCLASTDAGNPCGVCESCKQFDGEKNFDYIELDAASVGGKEEMVKLKDDAAFLPIGKKKIILLDECHDISKQGQDALLKQVEQCPPHLIYLFCTTEPEKIKPTLRKRCTQFQFTRVAPDLIYNRLKQVCEFEKITYEDDAIKGIAEKADGHVRDSLKLLEEATYFGAVTVEAISKIMVDYTSMIADILGCLGTNLPRAMELCKEITMYIPVWEFYEQMVNLVTDAVKVIYGYEDFLPKRKEILIRLRDIHGCNLIEFMNYLLSREKFIDRIGLTSDIILLHYKFCTSGFKPQIPEQKIVLEQPVMVQTPLPEKAPSVLVQALTHDKIMSLPLNDRLKKIIESRSTPKVNGQEKEENQKLPNQWSLPKEEIRGADSSDVYQGELTPLEFSRLLVGGRGGGSI